MKLNQPKHYPKGWGHEVWIHNDDKYCGKSLNVLKDKRCSLHFHKLKHETFLVTIGTVDFEFLDLQEDQRTSLVLTTHPLYEFNDRGVIVRPSGMNTKHIILLVGDSVEIPPGTPHRFTGMETENQIIEFSTRHYETDSYRILRGD